MIFVCFCSLLEHSLHIGQLIIQWGSTWDGKDRESFPLFSSEMENLPKFTCTSPYYRYVKVSLTFLTAVCYYHHVYMYVMLLWNSFYRPNILSDPCLACFVLLMNFHISCSVILASTFVLFFPLGVFYQVLYLWSITDNIKTICRMLRSC